MVARREILNTEQVEELSRFSSMRALADSHELLRADRDALAEALKDTERALTVWEQAVGAINVYPPEVREALAKARATLAVHGSGEEPGA